MIRVLNLTHSTSAITQTLMKLEDVILLKNIKHSELKKECPETDIIVIPALLLSQIKKNQLSSMKVLVWVEPSDDLSATYEFSKQHNVTTIISQQNLSRIDHFIKESYQNLLKQKQEKIQTDSPKLIQIVSFKAGSGCSFFSYHFTHLLATHIRQTSLLIDLGSPLGSSKGVLNLDSEYSWLNLKPMLYEKQECDDALINIAVQTPYNFRLLTHPPELFSKNLTLSESDTLFETAKKSFAVTVVDRGVIHNQVELDQSSTANLMIILLTPDPQSIYNTYTYYSYLKETHPNLEPLFILNMFESNTDKPLLTQLKEKFGTLHFQKVEFDAEAVRFYSRKYQLVSNKKLMIYEDLSQISEEVFKRLY